MLPLHCWKTKFTWHNTSFLLLVFPVVICIVSLLPPFPESAPAVIKVSLSLGAAPRPPPKKTPTRRVVNLFGNNDDNDDDDNGDCKGRASSSIRSMPLSGGIITPEQLQQLLATTDLKTKSKDQDAISSASNWESNAQGNLASETETDDRMMSLIDLHSWPQKTKQKSNEEKRDSDN